MNDLLTLDDIAAMIGLPRAYVRDKLVKKPQFPAPALRLSQRIKKWDAARVREWLDRQAEDQAR